MAINFFVSRDSIYAIFRKQIDGKRINLTYYPGIPAGTEWNQARQRFNSKTAELEKLNKQILQIEVAFDSVLDKYEPALLDNKKLAKLIDETLKERPKQTPFFEYCEIYFEHTVNMTTRRRAQCFRTAINKIKEYDPELTFEKIDKRFYRDFTKHLRDKDFSANYIGSVIRDLKRILNYATENDDNKNMVFKTFHTPIEEVFNIYLTEEEIERIYNLEIDIKTVQEFFKNKEEQIKERPENIVKALNRARKLFVIGCWTGLRVENYLNIDQDMQVDLSTGFIHAIANKNGPKLRIPIHKLVRKIVEIDGFPQSISQQKLNKHIKTLGELAKINDVVIFTRTKGNVRMEYAKKKFEMITTHTARRSFASNLISRGIPKQFIMAVTGHKTESSFNKYTAAVQKDIMTSKLADYDVWNGEKPVQKKSQEIQAGNLHLQLTD